MTVHTNELHHNARTRGEAVATVLNGVWRASPPPLDVPGDVLTAITPLLLHGGTASLCWRRLRGSALAKSRAARPFQKAYREGAVHAIQGDAAVQHAVTCLRSAGVEPILIKGWSLARLYPEPGLRPHGDVDLCVRPDQMAAAMTALTRAADRVALVDLHEGVPDLPDRTWNEVVRQSRCERLAEGEVRILGPEDHLRLVCLHQVRHGLKRPLWLCDAAAILESRPADFDWGRCLAGDPRRTRWLLAVLELAHRLLDARLDGSGLEKKREATPSWLLAAVLGRWGFEGGRRHSLGRCLRHPGEAWQALLYDGLNPIKSTFRCGVGPCRLPALLGQGLAVFHRLAKETVRTVRRLGGRQRRLESFQVHR